MRDMVTVEQVEHDDRELNRDPSVDVPFTTKCVTAAEAECCKTSASSKRMSGTSDAIA